jgi:hypothetical protein
MGQQDLSSRRPESVLGQSGHAGSILATQRYGAFGNMLAASVSERSKIQDRCGLLPLERYADQLKAFQELKSVMGE